MNKARRLRHIRSRLREAQQGACCYCRKSMRKYEATGTPKGGWPHDAETLEHLRRKVDGGKDHSGNLALACYECNVGRGSVDWLTYASYKAGELAA